MRRYSTATRELERNVFVGKSAVVFRLAVFPVRPVQHARPLVGFVVAELFLLPPAHRLVGRRARTFAGLEAVLPFFAFQVVVVFGAEQVVELFVFRLLRVVLRRFFGGIVAGFVPGGGVELAAVFLLVVVVPAFVRWVIGVGGEQVEGEAGAGAIWRGAHPEAFEALRVVDDLLEPDFVAHERAAAVQAVALAGLVRGGEAVLPARLLLNAGRHVAVR